MPDLIDGATPTKHLPPRKDVQKTDLIEDPMEELDEQRAALQPQIKTTKKNPDQPASFASDQGGLDEGSLLSVVSSAMGHMDQTFLRLDPSLAFRIAQDMALAVIDTNEEFSPFNLVDPPLYSRLLATLAGEYGFQVAQEGVEASSGREARLAGIDLIEDAQERVAAVREVLLKGRRHLREQIANFDAYVQRAHSPEISPISHETGKQGLVEIDGRIDEEILKLDAYQQKLREALKREINRCFEEDLGVSPMVQIGFNDVRPGEGGGKWVLAFTVNLEETFDSRIDRRLDADESGNVTGADIDTLLAEAGNKIRRKLGIIRRCFEKFLKGETEVKSSNTLYGSPMNGKYRAFAKFNFRVSVEATDAKSIRFLTVAISDALNDLMNAEYGRLASRSRTTMADWYSL